VIGSLTGLLADKSPPQLQIDVGGVGYDVFAPMSTFYTLPAVGQRVRLLTHLVVREDAHILYGFGTEGERRLFRMLLKVSGVGPRIALAILSGTTAEGFAAAVQVQDSVSLTRIPGVGRKIAERLVVEMRDKLADSLGEPFAPTADGAVASGVPRFSGSAESEAFRALVALDYKPAEATRLLRNAVAGISAAELSTEDLIRRALQSADRE
jgi:Holliday junction DNA helicase RuvA